MILIHLSEINWLYICELILGISSLLHVIFEHALLNTMAMQECLGYNNSYTHIRQNRLID